jgi:type II secretion system protein G
MKVWAQKQKGFTIVELLVVIVVIGILASISVVSYNGVQKRARDSARDSAVRTIRLAMEVYKSDANVYPSITGVAAGSGSNISGLTSSLVPTYISKVPNDPDATKNINYVINSSGDGYGMYVLYESRPQCKYLIGNNTSTGWYGTGVATCP